MDDIQFYDRYSQTIKTEKVYGDRALKWTYGSLAGKISLHLLVKRAVFSRWYGWRMDRSSTREKILPFVTQYELDPSEFVRELGEFTSFNDFFYRKLKPEARPINPTASVAVFPADGRHLCIPDISRTNGLFVKGQMFSLSELLNDIGMAKSYASGSLLLSRLCPVDYHRFHFPVGGLPGQTRLINGPLYSVNPIALRQNINILASNKRCITELKSEQFGNVLLIEVGATCVGSICQTFQSGKQVAKGDEKGFFKFGGSSTITIFEPNRIRFDDDLIEHSSQHRELFARMGDSVGQLL
ncbi:MAG: phosphatidylserine decarboxylase [Pirellula sp.]|jgi:phosphatidylserine decarboxylase|nr:phosphatidylserine decarboxylase [Pirellula sp.]